MEGSRLPPEGTIALLFTDIEGSTRLAASLGPMWPEVLADHHEILGHAIAAEDGFVDGIEGDSFFCTFANPAAAARAAVEALRALHARAWPAAVGELKVRMGLHVGHVERRPTGYVGLEIHRAARVAAAAHGGQLLLTGAARPLVAGAVETEPLGLHRLADFPAPEALFCAVVDGRGAAAFPPPRTHPLRPTNLPAGTPVLIGRERELACVRDAIIHEGERLVTVIGRGGVGKTSLALVAATELLDQHPGGVWLVRLAGVSSPEEVLPAVASAIGAEGEAPASALELVVGRLRERGPTLVILDNLEHVVASGPELAAMLDALANLRLLVTSQVLLRLPTERCVPLDALDDEAALTLMERVAERRGLSLSALEGRRQTLLDIAHFLDGLPLTLELAAARLALLSPDQLRARLESSPDLLKEAGGNRPDRHRSLRATVDWTLRLLDDPARTLFERMGVFAGAVELEEIEAIVGADGLDVLEALAGLLDVALVRRVEPGDGRVRLGLPEALRQIAAERLDAAPDGECWRRAHAQRQLELAWAARTTWVTRDVLDTALAAGAEAAAALRWSRMTADPLAAPLGAARGSILNFSGRAREALEMLEPLIEHPSGDPAVDALALTARASALLLTGRIDVALETVERAMALEGDLESQAIALMVRGMGRLFRGDHEGALRDHQQATDIARDLGPAALYVALGYEARVRLLAGDQAGAELRLDEAERVALPIEGRNSRHELEALRGDLAVRTGHPVRAVEHYARALEDAQLRGDELQVLAGLGGLVRAFLALERDAEALELIGIAQAQAAELSGGPGLGRFGLMLAGGFLAEAEQRLGPEAAAEIRARGSAVAAGYRVTRGCQLARMRPVA